MAATAGQFIFLIFILGMFIGVLGTLLIVNMAFPPLTQDSLNDVCKNFNENSTRGRINLEGKLECIIPSFDHTENIIMKKTGDK